jgi:hypothetical protein
MHSIHATSEMRIPNRAERLKEDVIATFCKPAYEVGERLVEFYEDDWRKAMYWLDVSGLALYFFDRLAALGLKCCLPEFVLERLQQSLDDNRLRTAALFQETAEISRTFQQRGISFAVLKGFTLIPDSVPDSALRYQANIDFLVAAKDATIALHCLKDFGYRLSTVKGKTWECKAGVLDTLDIRNLYKVHAHRSVELHLQAACASESEQNHKNSLTRVQYRAIHGAVLPALSPNDILLQQAFHLFRQLCDEHTRASWMLEYRQHVLARKNNPNFWNDLELLARTEAQAAVAVGAVTLLATQMFGNFAPDELWRWSMQQLPAPVCLWIEMYGRRALLTDFPGSKLYLLLRAQVRTNLTSEPASSRRVIFPFHLPAQITQPEAGERVSSRLRRYRIQVGFVFFRLRFHLVQGMRYAIEASRWHRRLTGMAQ